MSHCFTTYTDKQDCTQMKGVTNLGYLLRNWKRVEYLGFNYNPDSKDMTDGELVAKFKDGHVYNVSFSDLTVAFRFCRRSVFDTLELRVYRTGEHTKPGRAHIIGNEEYRAILRLPYAEQLKAILPKSEKE